MREGENGGQNGAAKPPAKALPELPKSRPKPPQMGGESGMVVQIFPEEIAAVADRLLEWLWHNKFHVRLIGAAGTVRKLSIGPAESLSGDDQFHADLRAAIAKHAKEIAKLVTEDERQCKYVEKLHVSGAFQKERFGAADRRFVKEDDDGITGKESLPLSALAALAIEIESPDDD